MSKNWCHAACNRMFHRGHHGNRAATNTMKSARLDGSEILRGVLSLSTAAVHLALQALSISLHVCTDTGKSGFWQHCNAGSKLLCRSAVHLSKPQNHKPHAQSYNWSPSAQSWRRPSLAISATTAGSCLVGDPLYAAA